MLENKSYGFEMLLTSLFRSLWAYHCVQIWMGGHFFPRIIPLNGELSHCMIEAESKRHKRTVASLEWELSLQQKNPDCGWWSDIDKARYYRVQSLVPTWTDGQTVLPWRPTAEIFGDLMACAKELVVKDRGTRVVLDPQQIHGHN